MNLNDEQTERLNRIRANIAQVQAELSKIDEVDPVNWKFKATLEKELADLEKQKKDIEDKNEAIEKKLENFRSRSYSDTSADTVFKINVDNETIILSGKGNSLKNLLRQYCVNFSHFENPFKASYTAAQKKELVEGITGRPQVLNSGSANNPTPHSFEWFSKE